MRSVGFPIMITCLREKSEQLILVLIDGWFFAMQSGTICVAGKAFKRWDFPTV